MVPVRNLLMLYQKLNMILKRTQLINTPKEVLQRKSILNNQQILVFICLSISIKFVSKFVVNQKKNLQNLKPLKTDQV